jgi:hypothetical protein
MSVALFPAGDNTWEMPILSLKLCYRTELTLPAVGLHEYLWLAFPLLASLFCEVFLISHFHINPHQGSIPGTPPRQVVYCGPL